MSNMSYCRFRNTVGDLQDCYDNWDDMDEASEEPESKARARLLKICKQIVADYGDDDE